MGLLLFVLCFFSMVVFGRNFTLEKPNHFALDGMEVRLVSSNFHYFRVPSGLVYDRLSRLLALGVNAVEVYVPWNIHEPQEGVFDFDALTDFLKTAQSLDLMVLLRPGPYICAEWDFGGFPGFLLNKEGLKLRTYNEPYITAVESFWKTLFGVIKPYTIENGGPIVMVQVENEFGNFGDTGNSFLPTFIRSFANVSF